VLECIYIGRRFKNDTERHEKRYRKSLLKAKLSHRPFSHNKSTNPFTSKNHDSHRKTPPADPSPSRKPNQRNPQLRRISPPKTTLPPQAIPPSTLTGLRGIANRADPIRKMRGLLKTDQPTPTDQDVAAMLEERRMEKYL
jgi:hypothetical protein